MAGPGGAGEVAVVIEVLTKTLGQVAATFAHTWPYLLLGVLVAVATKLWVGQERLQGWFRGHRGASVLAALALAVATPLCSCGTMAVILAMLATSVPWAPIVAFMVASPLTSPAQLLYTAGLFGWTFAGVHFASAIALGLAGALAAEVFESRGWLRNQVRFAGAGGSLAPIAGGSGVPIAADAAVVAPTQAGRPGLAAFVRESVVQGRRLLVLFAVFAFAGYLLNNLIPAAWVTALFGAGQTWGVPLAATLGLPLYVNSDASLPLVRAFLDGGASPGAAMAFLITGAGTSVGAVVGALTIARWRVLALVVATLWVGAVVWGGLFNAALARGIF